MEASQTPPAAEAHDPTAEGEAAPLTDAQREQAEAEGTQGQTITGDQGEQVPANATGADPDRPVAQSPPPPEAQSGVPLQEDRAAGVEAGPAGPLGASGQGGTEGEATPSSPTEGGSAVTPAEGEQPSGE